MDNTPTTDTSAPAALGLLAGKVAFITGAGRGIGAAAARLFARRAPGYCSRPGRGRAEGDDRGGPVAGGTAEYVMCDLADAASVRAAVDRAVDLYGRLDIAFNNGATIVPPGPLDQVREADFDHVYIVNLKGLWLAMAAEVTAIRATAGTGAIVNNSSVGSTMGNPPRLRRDEARGQQPHRARRRHLRPRGHPRQRHRPRHHTHRDGCELNDNSPGIVARLKRRPRCAARPTPTRSPRPPPGSSATVPPT
jgi:NAD(P)-dependent dehydrogenase (short-subunit alcohol dehydrogenase family)